MPIFSSQYPANSNPAGEDKILTTDTSDADAVKSVTLTKLQEWLAGVSKWVVTSMIADGAVDTLQIADGAVTADKVDFATLNFGNYSTSEVDTGFTWIDGKKIYKKTLNFGALPNNTVKAVAHGVTGMTWLIDIEGSSYDGAARIAIPYATTSPVWAYGDQTNITVATTSNRTNFSTTYITIKYTK